MKPKSATEKGVFVIYICLSVSVCTCPFDNWSRFQVTTLKFYFSLLPSSCLLVHRRLLPNIRLGSHSDIVEHWWPKKLFYIFYCKCWLHWQDMSLLEWHTLEDKDSISRCRNVLGDFPGAHFKPCKLIWQCQRSGTLRRHAQAARHSVPHDDGSCPVCVNHRAISGGSSGRHKSLPNLL